MIMTKQLFQIEDTYQIGMLLLVIGMIIICPLSFKKWTFIDIGLGIITIYDIISCFYSNCTIPAIRTAVFSASCMGSYLILRRLFGIPRISLIFIRGSIISIGIALILAFCSFFIFRNSVFRAGFEDTYQFRFLFRPLGYIPNVWAELSLISLGWFCLARRYSIFLSLFAILAILLSFSRGAYIALLVYLITWAITMKPLRQKIKIPVACLSATVIIGIFFTSEFKNTLSMSSTVSQQRSTEWRVNAIISTWNILKEYPFFGQGNNSYTFAIDRISNQDSTQNYTSYAPNLLIQLLIEKGIIGTLFYLILAIVICIYLWKHRFSTDVCIIGCTLLALFVKEMTQSTITSTPFTCFSVYILLALMQRKEESTENIKTGTEYKNFLIPGIVLLIYVVGCIINKISYHNEEICKDSFAELAKGNTTNAAQLIEKTGKQVPYLVQRGILYTECYLKTKERTYADKAELSLAEAHERQPKDVHINYLQAYLYLQKGENEKASSLLTRLATCYPKNSLFLYTLGENLYRNGKKKKALAYWADAIYLTPRLLSMKRITNLQHHDQVFYDSLKYQLCTLDTIKLRTPIDWARYGYIMYWYGNQQTATLYLKKAVTLLPNLATPWHLLGEEKKYRLLTFGAFQGDSSYVPHEQEMTDKRLLYLAYKFKFQSWYGCCLSEY